MFDWRDGRNSAGQAAASVKSNMEAVGQAADDARKIIRQCLWKHAVFNDICLPLRSTGILLSKYEGGDRYGNHVDNPTMRDGNVRIRTDCSMTVFISDTKEYEGGFLTFPAGYGLSDQSYRVSAGSAICYPSHFLHHVSPVKSGVRLVAILWFQSLVRDHDKREILAKLERIRTTEYARNGKTETFDLAAITHANLLRMWSDV